MSNIDRYEEGTPPLVLIRDLFLFLVKLFLDGIKDLVFIWLSVAVVILELLLGGTGRGRLFYALMRLGERWDLWLNLYGASKNAAGNRDGLFGESRAGDPTFLGEMEGMVRKEERSRTPLPGARR